MKVSELLPLIHGFGVRIRAISPDDGHCWPVIEEIPLNERGRLEYYLSEFSTYDVVEISGSGAHLGWLNLYITEGNNGN